MLSETKKEDLFCEYYARWIMVYKKGAIRKVTMDKYLMTQKWLEKLIPELKIREMNRIAYQPEEKTIRKLSSRDFPATTALNRLI